jgi:hypothetical protein
MASALYYLDRDLAPAVLNAPLPSNIRGLCRPLMIFGWPLTMVYSARWPEMFDELMGRGGCAV